MPNKKLKVGGWKDVSNGLVQEIIATFLFWKEAC